MPKLNIPELLYECTVSINDTTKDMFGIKDAFPAGIINYIRHKPMQTLYENALLYRLGKEIPGIEYTDKDFRHKVSALPPTIYSQATLDGDIKDLTLEEFYGNKFQAKMAEATKLIADTIEGVFAKHLGKQVQGKFTRDINPRFNKSNQLNCV